MNLLCELLESNSLQNIILMITVVATVVIYLLQKHRERKDAARIIVMQIDSINQKTDFLLRILGTDVRFINFEAFWQVGDVIDCNEWKKYRHLFGKKLNYNEIVALNNYYDNVILIKNQQQEIKKTMSEINIAFYKENATVVDSVFYNRQQSAFVRVPTLYVVTIQKEYEKILNSRTAIPYQQLKKIAGI